MKTRLKKVADESGFGGNGFSSVTLLLGNPEELVDNKDEINKTTYGPSIQNSWDFEKPLDYAEWQLVSNKNCKRLKNNLKK